MIFQLLADLVVVVHLIFIVFVILGGLIALWWQPVIWLHLPVLLWGILIEIFGWVCPLTPLENTLRNMAGETSYRGGFIAHYIEPVIYPAGLTPGRQILLGIALIAFNAVVYFYIWRQHQ